MAVGGRGFWIFVAILVVVHFGLHVGLGIGPAAPDVLTVAVLLAARTTSGGVAAVIGLALGLVQDALSLFSFGANAIVLAALGFLGARSRDLFVGESLLFLGGYLFLGKWLRDVGYYFLAGTAAREGITSSLLVDAPIAALYSAVVGIGALLFYSAITGER